jgi:hypothetical protein
MVRMYNTVGTFPPHVPFRRQCPEAWNLGALIPCNDRRTAVIPPAVWERTEARLTVFTGSAIEKATTDIALRYEDTRYYKLKEAISACFYYSYIRDVRRKFRAKHN